MASSTSRPPQTDDHPMNNDNNNHETPLPTTENKNCEDPPGNAKDNQNTKNTNTNANNDDNNKNNKDKIEHDGTEKATTTGTDTATTTKDDDQLNTAPPTHKRNNGTENESNNMRSNTATPIERKGGAHKGNIITSHHIRIQGPETTGIQQRKNPGKAVESTEPNSELKISSATGINNSDMDSWADFSTDDEHMDSPNNSDNENRSDGSTESRIEEMIIFEHPTESEPEYNKEQTKSNSDTKTTDDQSMEQNTKTDKENDENNDGDEEEITPSSNEDTTDSGETCDCSTSGLNAVEKSVYDHNSPTDHNWTKVHRHTPPNPTKTSNIIKSRTTPKTHVAFADTSSEDGSHDFSDKGNKGKKITRITPLSQRQQRTGRGSGGGHSGDNNRGSKSRPRQQNEIYEITIRYNPNTAKNSSGGNVLQKACTEIYTKTGFRGIFYPTTDITPAPAPITDISQNLPQKESGAQDFFRFKTNPKGTQVTFYLSIGMPGTDLQLHKNTKNYFRNNNLWMDNEEIQRTRQQYAGFVLYANPSYTSRHNLAIKINTALKQTASTTEALSIQYEKTDGNLVSCHAGAIRGQVGVHSDGVIMRTSNANAKLTATLLAAQDDEILGPYYKMVPKGMDTTFGPEYHDKLLINNNVEINNQRAITIINIPYDGFFAVKFNPTPDIQGSTKITINSYLIHQCKIVSVERTSDVEATGKYFLIVRNNDFIQAKTKIARVLHKFRQAAPTIAMQDSYSKFHAYPEIVDGIRHNPTLTTKGERMKLFLDQTPD